MSTPIRPVRDPVGTESTTRLRPKLRYELIGCGLHGHELLGTEVAEVRPQDHLVARADPDGLRWYRCLRCDSWLPLLPPQEPRRQHLRPREEIDLPLRGKPLRDKYVLRLIAADRFVHFLVLGVLAAAVLVFAHDRSALNSYWVKIARDLQAGVGGPTTSSSTGLVGKVDSLFSTSSSHLLLAGLALGGYAVLEGTEAFALWWGKRWAEYLTLIATAVLLIPEVYELADGFSVLKALTFLINAAVVVYLLFAKRLFGLRGGAAAEQHERDLDTGWEALERTLPAVRPHDAAHQGLTSPHRPSNSNDRSNASTTR
jgi:uncharacterized membrane protein (DUF2068 family)